MSEDAVDNEVGGGVCDLEDVAKSAGNVEERAAVPQVLVHDVEPFRRQVTDAEHDHDYDDDASYAVLVAGSRRRHRRRRRVGATSSRGDEGSATATLGAVDTYQKKAEDRQDEERQNERHHRVHDASVDDTKALRAPEFGKLKSECHHTYIHSGCYGRKQSASILIALFRIYKLEELKIQLCFYSGS